MLDTKLHTRQLRVQGIQELLAVISTYDGGQADLHWPSISTRGLLQVIQFELDPP